MKKSITTYDDLLVSLVSKGDPVAFYNLSFSYFRNQYISLRQEGKTDSETKKNILSNASEMYKKVLHSKQVDIHTLFQTETSESGSESAEFHLETTQFDWECSEAMDVLNRHLQRLASKHNLKKLSDKGRFSRNPVVKLTSAIVMAAMLFTGLYAGMHLSGTFVQFSFKHKGKGFSFSFPLQSKDSTSRIETPVNPVKTAETIDSVKTVSTHVPDSIQAPPEKPVKIVRHKKPPLASTDPSLQSPQTTQNSLSGTITQPASQPVKTDPQVRENSETRIPSVPINPQTP